MIKLITKHEKLKTICDKIGYDYIGYYIFQNGGIQKLEDGGWIKINVRQIIFTQDFMDKFIEYKLSTFNTYKEAEEWRKDFAEDCFEFLDNVVDYLYNLIK